jgi:hypothetical protein
MDTKGHRGEKLNDVVHKKTQKKEGTKKKQKENDGVLQVTFLRLEFNKK